MSDGPQLELEWIPGRYAVARLAPREPIPAWVPQDSPTRSFLSICRSDQELSILTLQEYVPDEVEAEREWVALRVVGELDFGLIGILAKLTGALAEQGVSVFAVSTFQTDVLLIKARQAAAAEQALGQVALVHGRCIEPDSER